MLNLASAPIPVVFELPDKVQEQLFSNLLDNVVGTGAWDRVTQIHSGVGLVAGANGLAMRNADSPQQTDISIDFCSPALNYRKSKGGGKSELLIKAIGMKGASDYKVIDATAGMGTDAFVMASVGCSVTMLERSPLVAALLTDALTRLRMLPEAEALATRLSLIHGNAVDLFKQWQREMSPGVDRPDAIYLDPMFPHRRKSALVKKEMQALQQLLGVDPDADAMLEPALNLAKKRVVVKRPASAPFLGQRKPNMSMNSKKHRFDVYLI